MNYDSSTDLSTATSALQRPYEIVFTTHNFRLLHMYCDKAGLTLCSGQQLLVLLGLLAV